jgi:hypothetical protein
MVKAGKFREDLYYRLNVVTISAGVARTREDIPILVERFSDVRTVRLPFDKTPGPYTQSRLARQRSRVGKRHCSRHRDRRRRRNYSRMCWPTKPYVKALNAELQRNLSDLLAILPSSTGVHLARTLKKPPQLRCCGRRSRGGHSPLSYARRHRFRD